jgi:hypothetical protein
MDLPPFEVSVETRRVIKFIIGRRLQGGLERSTVGPGVPYIELRPSETRQSLDLSRTIKYEANACPPYTCRIIRQRTARGRPRASFIELSDLLQRFAIRSVGPDRISIDWTMSGAPGRACCRRVWPPGNYAASGD